MVALWNSIFALWFLSSSFFFSSPSLSHHRLDVCTQGVALVQIYNAGLKCIARASLEMQDAKNRGLGTIAQLCQAISSQLRHVLTIGNNLLNTYISSTCPHKMVNYSLLAAETVLLVCGIPANFNGFRVLALLLQQRHSTETQPNFSQCLALTWAGKLYIHFWQLLLSNRILPGAKFSLRPPSLHSAIGSVTARQSSSGRQPNFAVLSTGCHLYSAG